MRKRNFLKVFWVVWIIFTFFMFIGLANPAEKVFPNRAIEIVVPSPAGGVVDIAWRIVSEEFSKNLGVPVIIVNKAGGGYVLGFQAVVQSKPDGYTLFATPNSVIIIGSVVEPEHIKLSDMIHIARFITVPNLFVVKKDSPFKTLEDVLAFAKKNPGKVVSSAGAPVGGSTFTLEILKMEAGVDISNIPFQGGGESLTALMGGHINLGVIGGASVYGFLKSGELRCLASSAGRVPGFPEIPTLAEKGYPKATFGLWVGLSAPKGVDKSVVEIISKTFEKTVKTPAVVKRLEESGNTFDYLAGEKLAQEIEEDYKKVAEVVKRMKLTPK